MQALIINPDDDVVAVALADLKAGTQIELPGYSITLRDDIPRGHKFALRDIAAGSPVIKYGYPIGTAKELIYKGQHVHTHNVKTALKGAGTYSYHPTAKAQLKHVSGEFMGFARPDGKVGIRNQLWIVPTVFCVNEIARELALYANSKLGSFANVDNAVALCHPFGCSQMGEDQETTQRVLAALCTHQNAGAVLVIGLGCENNNLNVFKQFLNVDDERLAFLNAQEVEDELQAGYELVDTLLDKANQCTRSVQPLSKLVIGLKCGGSDGLSGITANPLIGRVSDLVVAAGGTSVMTEVPEMFGAEQMLMNRSVDAATFDKVVKLINDFKHYFESNGETVSENPSPGNKAGGITTLEDKSLGCVQKGGKAPVSDVVFYGDKVKTQGLNLLQGPGSDGVSCSALAAAGVDIILFSTGRGTPFATVVPTIKISTNSNLFARKGGNWIDFNAGVAAEGKSLDDLALELLDFILQVASGKESVSEKRGFHELLIWKNGVTL